MLRTAPATRPGKNLKPGTVNPIHSPENAGHFRIRTPQAPEHRPALFRRTVLLWLLLPLLLSAGCGRAPVYDRYQPVGHASWPRQKTFYFSFEITDTRIPYDLTLQLRNNNRYPYRNLWIAGEMIPPAGWAVRDTTEYTLADEQGKWKGNGFSLFTHLFPLRTNYYFPAPGRYTFGFSQLMNDDTLPGIHEIGLRVEKSEKKEESMK